MAKVVKKLQDNWKKLVLFSGASAYGVKYATNKYEELDIRRQYCKKAQAYGQQCLYPNENPRKVTVFLNPAANNRKCTQLFDKNAAPLFHLAGLDVTVIKTEREGQAKAYMDVIGLEDTDAIVVAGGDGTVAEVMTGLLRRKDQDFVKRISIGILPLGETNSLARSIFSDTASQVRWICESALAVVEGLKRPIDLMAITGNEGKTVYAASSIQWSHFRDAETTKSKYWYFGPLKHRWTYVWATVKKWPPELKARLSYILPCSGCSKCETPPPPEEKKQRGWLSFLLPPPKKKEPVKDYAHIINEECGVEHKLDVNTSELTVLSSNLLEKQTPKGMEISIGPDNLSKMDFIKEGWRRQGENQPHRGAKSDERFKIFTAGEFTLSPELPEGQENWFSIDMEQFEAMPIKVKLKKDIINVFHRQSTTEPALSSS